MKIVERFDVHKILIGDLAFLLLIVLMSCAYYDSILKLGPLNAHVWRQADCLSLTHNYKEGADFLKPEMHVLLGDNNTSGLTAGEFPILYYSIGKVWKLFGESYFSYRLIYLLILLAGVFSFYKSLRIVFDNFWIAALLAALLFTSPAYVLYGVSFLTDAPAFSFTLIGLYFMVLYKYKDKRSFFYLSMAFLALAGLIKVSSLMAFFFLFGIFVLENLSFKSLQSHKLFRTDKHEWLGFFLVFASIFAWYYYAHYFNVLHGFKYTFNNIFPLWNKESHEMSTLWSDVTNFTSYVFFSRPVLWLLAIVGLGNLFLIKKIPAFVYLTNIAIIAASAAYVVLWGPLLGVHDYYFLALMILFVGIFIPFFYFIKLNYPRFFQGYFLPFFLAGFLVYNFMYCSEVVKLKTFEEKIHEFQFVKNENFIKLMTWTNWNTRVNGWRFERMRPYLAQIGVKKEDKVISIPDQSFNVTLYLSGQKGWSSYIEFNEPYIRSLIQKGAKYLFVSDPELLKQDYLQPFIHDKVGSFEGVEIYKL